MKTKQIVLALAAAAWVAAPANAAIPESKDPIKLAMNDWTGQHISTRVVGEVLKGMGYNVEYVTAGMFPQMIALEDGTISATMELWSSNVGEHYDKAVASGNVEELGGLGLVPVETWFYNDAAKAKCPGLPSYQALNDCAAVFANAETHPQGRFVDYPADWGTTNVDRLKALGLNFTSVPAGSEGALVAEMTAAEVRKAPLLVMFWAPHWVHAKVKLHPVELPPYQAGCYDDASVGVNSSATYDCDWERGYIKKMAWKGVAEKWPGAAKVLRAYKLRNADQIPMMNAIDQEGKKLESVVAAWLDDNKSTWKKWVKAAK